MKLMAFSTTGSVPSAEKMTATPKAPATGSSVKVVEAEGFLFRPISCTRTAGKTICTIQFVNNGNDEREFNVVGQWSPPSYLYDNFGNQYPITLQIGKQNASNYIREKFVPQVPVNVQFIAEDVSPEASSVIITIGINTFKKSVAIRDIPITR